MSDRQDRQDKSVWWSVTAFTDAEIAELSGTQFPRYIRKVFGGLEKCPTTDKVHFQGAIQCQTQQRFSALKKWLPTAHLEVARSAEALVKYAMKQDTAVGDKQVSDNTTPYAAMHEMLIKIASAQIDVSTELVKYLDLKNCKNADEEYREEYIYVTRHILSEAPNLVTAFMIPAMEKAWIRYRSVWIARALVLQAQATEELELLAELSLQEKSEEQV